MTTRYRIIHDPELTSYPFAVRFNRGWASLWLWWPIEWSQGERGVSSFQSVELAKIAIEKHTHVGIKPRVVFECVSQ